MDQDATQSGVSESQPPNISLTETVTEFVDELINEPDTGYLGLDSVDGLDVNNNTVTEPTIGDDEYYEGLKTQRTADGKKNVKMWSWGERHNKYYLKIPEYARRGDLETLKACIDQNMEIEGTELSVLLKVKQQGCTALHYAALYNHIPVVEFLLSFDECDFDEPNLSGRTPIHWAALKGHLRIVQLLVEKSRSKYLDTGDSITPLSNSNATGSNSNFNPSNDIDDVSSVPKHLELLYKRDKAGESVIHKAAQSGSLPLLQYLINELKIDPNTLSSSPHSSSSSSSSSNANNFTTSLGSGEKVSSFAKEATSALLECITHNQIDCIPFLLDSGADINHSNARGISPLLKAVIYKRLEILDILLENEMLDVNLKDFKAERTAFSWAAWYGNELVCEKFFEDEKVIEKLDLKTKDVVGYSVLDVATMQGRKRIERMVRRALKIKGIDLDEVEGKEKEEDEEREEEIEHKETEEAEEKKKKKKEKK